MEVEQPSISSHNGDQTGDNDESNWRRRLRLRKSSALSHTVKTVIEEKKIDKKLTKETSQNEQKDHQVVDTVSRKLTFTCSHCKDGTRFSPDGLLKHFKNFHGGQGHPPSFPCGLCNFVTPDFTTLKQHYLKHEHSKITYELCNDEGLQTPSQITKHCKTPNSQYQCEKCKLSAKELTHSPHNSCPHNTVPSTDSSQKSEAEPKNRNLLADVAGEPKKDAPLEHLPASCHRGWIRKNWWKNRDVAPKQPKHTAPDTKFVISKSEITWTSEKFLPFSAAGLLDVNGKLLHPTQTLQETKQFLERTVNCGQKWPVTLNDEPSPLPSDPKMTRCATPLPAMSSGSQLSDLMEKSNISVPADCTTKVVGFKMVDGKKHLVLKVIPLAKSEISSDSRKEPARLTQEKLNDQKLDSDIVRPSDQMCISKSVDQTTADSTFNVYDSTSTSRQSQKQGHYEVKEQNTIGDAPQVDNTEHDCSNDGGACTLGPDAPAQLALSGIKYVFDVASQTYKNSAPPEVTFNANDTIGLNVETVNVPGEVGSVRKKDIPTLQTNMREISDAPKHTDNLDKAANDYRDINSEPSTSQDDGSCIEALSSCASSDSVSMKEGINSQPLTLMTEKDRSPDIHVKNMDKMAWCEATVTHSPLDDQTEQKIKQGVNAPPNKNGVAMLDSNITDPTVPSFQKTTTDSLFISSSEQGSLFFQDREDENMNNTSPIYANVCLDQTCTVETLEEPNLSQLSLQDSCHNPDLYQTLEELPLTTMSHLLDDSEVAHRGIASQSEAGSMNAQQLGMHSSKAIPVTAVTNDKESSQLPLRTETASRKRPRQPTSKDSQGLISKSKRRFVPNSQENDFSASIPYWAPPPPDIERPLRLFPFRSSQAIKVPRRNQPVVVLNHPDTDIPEVANIMRTVHKHKGAVQRVVLSQGTLKALFELNCDAFRNKRADASQSSHYRRVWAKGTVKERFILNLKLKRLRGNKFKVANLSFNANHIQSSFTCWFCGRHFRNQEVWVGHGQRHIMEATRDWNKLFNNEVQGNSTDQQSFF